MLPLAGKEFAFIEKERNVNIIVAIGTPQEEYICSIVRAYLLSSELSDTDIVFHASGAFPLGFAADKNKVEIFPIDKFGAAEKNNLSSSGYEEDLGFETYFKSRYDRRALLWAPRLFKNNIARSSVIVYDRRIHGPRFIELLSTFPMWTAWSGPVSLSDEMMQVALAYSDGNTNKISITLKTICVSTGMENIVKKQYFKSLRDIYEKKFSEEYAHSLATIESNISDLKSQLAAEYDKRMKCQLIIAGAASVADNVDNPDSLCKYFEQNKNVDIQRFDDDAMVLSIVEPLMYWDQELIDRILECDNSVMYESLHGCCDKDAGKALWKAINESRAQIMLSGVFKLNIKYGGVSVFPGEPWAQDAYPNPHLMLHGCMGQNETYINEAVKEGHIIQAAEQCRVSVRSINFAEGPTSRPFFNDFIRADIQCVSINGELLTPLEAAEKLFKEEQDGA